MKSDYTHPGTDKLLEIIKQIEDFAATLRLAADEEENWIDGYDLACLENSVQCLKNMSLY